MKKLEAELFQQKAYMMNILQDSKVLKVSIDELMTDIQILGEELVSQTHAYQHWEDTLKTTEQIHGDCLAQWESLRAFDLS